MYNLPLVSVVIPVYNSVSTLHNCIQSVQNQDYSNIEIIIINDGSTDDSISIAKGYAATDPRVVIIDKKKNEGLVLARKSGIDAASGKYIQYLDSDDVLLDGAISVLVGKAEETGADIVVAPFYICTADGVENSLFFDFTELSGLDFLRTMLTWRMHWCVWSKFHLRSLYQHCIERPPISFGEDVILSTQLLFHSTKVVSINQAIINYNFNSSSMSHPDSFNDSKYEDFKGYIKWVDNYYSRNGLSDRLKMELAYFHLKTTMMKLHMRKIEDVNEDMKRASYNLKLYPNLSEILTRRERKIIMVYKVSKYFGYLNLVRYKIQNKL